MHPITRRYEESGSESGYHGSALSEIQFTPNGRGQYQEFQHGMIFYYEPLGATIVRESVILKWKNETISGDIAYETEGQTIQDYLGFPVLDSFETHEEWPICCFERGAIFVDESTALGFVIYGMAYIKY